MSDFYNRYSKLSKYPKQVLSISKYPKQVLSISEKEKAHSRLLAPDETGHVPKDIKKAEAELFSSWKNVLMDITFLTKYHDKCLMEKLTDKRMKTLDDVLNLD